LIVVLWSVLVLAFAVAMASERIAGILGDTSIRVKRFQAALLADSAFPSLELILTEDKQRVQNAGETAAQQIRPLDLKKFQGSWRSEPRELNGGIYWIEIKDEHSKINWLKTSPDIWRVLLENAGVTPQDADAWFDSLTDWQDGDDLHMLNGAESSDYQNLPDFKYRSKNAPVQDMGELFWIKGGYKMFGLKLGANSHGRKAALLPMTTIYGDGKININTAPAVLIAAALSMTVEGGEQVVRTRLGPDGIEGTQDDAFLTSVPPEILSNPATQVNLSTGAKPKTTGITTTSKLFRVRGVGEFEGQRVVREALSVVEGEKFRLLQEPRTVAFGPASKSIEL
jgi:type II secretory pathway component PulK